jgi:hypothetical protein
MLSAYTKAAGGKAKAMVKKSKGWEMGGSRMHKTMFAVPLLLLLAACGKINRDNFDRISDGMSKQQVVQLLGEPSESSGASLFGISGDSAVWRGNGTEIDVQFLNGKVIAKQMKQGGGE